jgi:hypothetical protein
MVDLARKISAHDKLAFANILAGESTANLASQVAVQVSDRIREADHE